MDQERELPQDAVLDGEMKTATEWQASGPVMTEPDDLALLQYPELRRRIKLHEGELENLLDEHGLDGTPESRALIIGKARELGGVREALARKRESSLGKGSKHKVKGADDGEHGQGDDRRDTGEAD